jgi:uncharacterized protein (DUF427 family)
MSDYPRILTPVNHVEPVPRRIRAVLGGEVVIDTIRAMYVWEWPNFPNYYIPSDDVRSDVLVGGDTTRQTASGLARLYGLRIGQDVRPAAALQLLDSPITGLTGMVRFDWSALDGWYEEDEQVYVHPRDPYTRVDALRSTRRVRVELDGVVLAESSSPVMVFETGLPTRHYLSPTDLFLEHLVESDTSTACPYKGITSRYWSVKAGGVLHRDLAWSYQFPTRELLPIAGLVAFYDELVDTFVDGLLLDRPVTHFG